LLPLKTSTKNPFILKSNLISKLTNEDLIDKSFNYQKSIKYNRQRQELVPVNLARRLLRTKRTLVLPAHVNITLITNSYDVVHS
jgi:heme/copper-type cytochrome/quinol oxidase subunit 2